MIDCTESNCYACGACIAICPMKCIRFVENEHGFSVATVTSDECINCAKCEAVCPSINKVSGYVPLSAYVARSKSKEVVRSTSGGVALELARHIIGAGGVVFGAAYDESMRLRMRAVSQVEGIRALQGSKYIQAAAETAAIDVISCLKCGKTVLYTGTPCQIAGIKRLLIKNGVKGRLYTADIICHGVLSPGLFRKYIQWEQDRCSAKPIDVRFRPQDYPFDPEFLCELTFESGEKRVRPGFMNPFYRLYFEGNRLRKTCYSCPYSAMDSRQGDISLGDCWNYQIVSKKMAQNRLSAVLVNTEAGLELLRAIAPNLDICEVDSKEVLLGSSRADINTAMESMAEDSGSEHANQGPFEKGTRGWRFAAKGLFNLLPRAIRIRVKRLFSKIKKN